MAERKSDFKESREILNPNESAWLAGVFEIGGNISFHIHYREGEPTYAYPYCELVDKSERIPLFVQKLCGGIVGKKQSRNGHYPTCYWRLEEGEKVAQLMSTIYPYAVSRREIITAITNWENEDREGRVLVAQEMRQEGKGKNPDKDYSEIIKNPAFLAGIIDRRGHVRALTKYKYPVLEIQSINKALLDALQNAYGGKTRKDIEANTKVELFGRKIIIKEDSYKWILSYKGSRYIVSQALPFMKTKPYEEWNEAKSRSRKRKVTNNLRDEEVGNHIKDELALFQQGKIESISTIQELAEKFSVSHTTMDRIFSRLSKKIKDQRREITYEERMNLSTQEIQDVVEKIVQEIEDFKQRKVTRLTTSDEWAKQLDNLSAVTFKIQVLSRLPDGIKKERQEIIRMNNLRKIQFSEGEITRNVRLITEEVQLCQNGNLAELRTNAELCQAFDANLSALAKFILSKLPPDISKMRTTLLRVQANKRRANK